jgi:hypothetical protein
VPQRSKPVFGVWQESAHPSFVRSRLPRNRGGGNAVNSGVEVLLTVLLVLMIPGLVTYLKPKRDPSAERADS